MNLEEIIEERNRLLQEQMDIITREKDTLVQEKEILTREKKAADARICELEKMLGVFKENQKYC